MCRLLRLPAATPRLITAEAKDTGAHRQQLTTENIIKPHGKCGNFLIVTTGKFPHPICTQPRNFRHLLYFHGVSRSAFGGESLANGYVLLHFHNADSGGSILHTPSAAQFKFAMLPKGAAQRAIAA
ncbi:hypothetical protein [Scytonema sp. PCC 10023]|uniref:hypothetical protein n=1 Tax=Scytonema sp. PCC 10023 TaxID=1680591 RepID=UPI0039C60F30